MSWPMPTVGQWAPGMAMATPDMNMGNYTPEQWTAFQQQNWQQWAQWQQQYAQWQTQYGEKYAQQMQAMQAMGGMPPLPTTAAAVPPAPPPPDKPPPPPPHENNQPLFGNAAKQPAPVPAPPQRNTNSGYINSNFSGNNQNLSQGAVDSQQETNQGAVNAEALKKLAEEERLFDIQFQKWEEEIDKWRKENVNHPDKEAYKEYEAKFEACRVQLLERRQQMKQRRARLLGNIPQTHTASTGNNKPSTSIPSLMQNPVPKPNFNQNVQSQNFSNIPGNFQNQNKMQNKYDNPVTYNKANNKNVDPQDRFEAYQSMTDYSTNPSTEKANFLPASSDSKGIPGLDLVPESDKPSNAEDVIDITEENSHPVAPDYSTISKGINNILGDEKIMNILSMVRGQTGPTGNVQNTPSGLSGPVVQTGQFGPGGSGSSNGSAGYSGSHGGPYGSNTNNYNVSTNQWDKNENQFNNNQLYGNRHNMPFNRQGQPPLLQNPIAQNRMYDDGQRDIPQEQYYDKNSQFSGQTMGPRLQGGRPNMPPGRPPLQEMPGQQNMNDSYRDSHDSSGMHDGRGIQNNRGMSDDRLMHENRIPINQPPPRPKWTEDPLFTPSIIVEYEHKPLRLKGREFIEPVHTFDYNHISKDNEYKKKDFEKEVDELFTRKPRRLEGNFEAFDRRERFSMERGDRFPRESPGEYERRRDMREDLYSRVPPRDEYEERRRPEPSYFDRRRDDRDKINRRDDFRDREDHRARDDFRDREDHRGRDDFRNREDHRGRDDFRDREDHRGRDDFRDRGDHRGRDDFKDRDKDRYRDLRSGDVRIRSRSRDRDLRIDRDLRNDRDSRKRGRSRESEASEHSKKSRDSEVKPAAVEAPKHVIMIDDILESPGREMRPEKIVIILRGPPGSGKSYLAKLIRDREAEFGGTARIMSIDDYFVQEGEVEEKDPNTGKMVKRPTMKYEYDESLEETYLNSLKRAFKRSLTDGYFSFLIFDAVNDQLKSYADIWNFARQNGFQVYICTMELDAQICFKRNIHSRSLEDIQVICSRFFPTPTHHIQLDPTTLLQSAAITEVHMEDATDDVIIEEHTEVENSFTSKWERMDDVDKLARLDGTSKPLRPSQLSMEDYLQIDDWKPTQAKPGKKTVRWADIEERREQEKMRAIGFVVGQTDWHRMTDPTMGSSALTQTKYIERVRRK